MGTTNYKHVLVCINGEPMLQRAVNIQTRLAQVLRFFTNPTQATRFDCLTHGRESSVSVTVDGWLVAEGIYANGRLWWHGDAHTVPASFVHGTQVPRHGDDPLVAFVADEHYERPAPPLVEPPPTMVTFTNNPALTLAREVATWRLSVAQVRAAAAQATHPRRRAQLAVALRSLRVQRPR